MLNGTITLKRVRLISSGTLLIINIVIGLCLLTVGRIADASIFLFLSTGMYWHIRTTLKQKQMPWYELTDMEVEKI